ncbi:class II fumarate hydratase [Coraliomargarita sp. SDUM461004]|uniref:Fumarate hydratase class II n=1 Tax=Thalassobacterium sedimentorum TaxID=3041258 RepID=A0ABU1AMX6_9BACT|nr:class II fumarate hydratase [Coraliomargarita sp. SDUM461004]MDQ8196152.1 class II fumarate hydratase [Coraliomargarita sp. SDUM461004]
MRTEKDSMGTMEVPDNALYGASTQRAVVNFPVSGHPMPALFIRSCGLLKYACAQANLALERINQEKADAISIAALEIYEGKHRAHFPLDVFQTGSGTSTNMNINEVIANRCSQLAGQPIGSKIPVHPNDDCNLGQSSNDTMPTALHLSVALALQQELKPALQLLSKALDKKTRAFKKVVKIGRTHLMDATPITLGQEFSGYVRQIKKALTRTDHAIVTLKELAIGGTAVGTGINGHPDFAQAVVTILNEKTQLHFIEAKNHFEAQAGRDDCVDVAGQLQAISASLTKIANDIRLLGSGPRCGLGELQLPATQPGSSIMPGKVNPVMCEMLVQACLYANSQCQTVVACGREGHFELNATIPLIAYSLHEAIQVLANSAILFTERCVAGLQVNEPAIAQYLENSLMLVTALNPHIGYDKASHVAKRAFAEGRTLREIVLEEKLMSAKSVDNALNPKKMV